MTKTITYERVDPRDYIFMFDPMIDDVFSALRKIRKHREYRGQSGHFICNMDALQEAIRLSKYVDEL